MAFLTQSETGQMDWKYGKHTQVVINVPNGDLTVGRVGWPDLGYNHLGNLEIVLTSGGTVTVNELTNINFTDHIRITAPDIFPAEIREGNTAAGIRFHTDAGALVDKQHVIILIDNRKGRNGRIISGNRIRQIDLQAAAFRQPVIP